MFDLTGRVVVVTGASLGLGWSSFKFQGVATLG